MYMCISMHVEYTQYVAVLNTDSPFEISGDVEAHTTNQPTNQPTKPSLPSPRYQICCEATDVLYTRGYPWYITYIHGSIDVLARGFEAPKILRRPTTVLLLARFWIFRCIDIYMY